MLRYPPHKINIQRLRKRQRGSVAVEFMLIAPFLIWITFAILEYGLYLNYLNTLNQLTRDGARYAAVHATETTAYQAGTVTGSIKNFMILEAGRNSSLKLQDSYIKLGYVNPSGDFTEGTPTAVGTNVAVQTYLDPTWVKAHLWGASLVPGIATVEAKGITRQSAFLIENPNQ